MEGYQEAVLIVEMLAGLILLMLPASNVAAENPPMKRLFIVQILPFTSTYCQLIKVIII